MPDLKYPEPLGDDELESLIEEMSRSMPYHLARVDKDFPFDVPPEILKIVPYITAYMEYFNRKNYFGAKQVD